MIFDYFTEECDLDSLTALLEDSDMEEETKEIKKEDSEMKGRCTGILIKQDLLFLLSITLAAERIWMKMCTFWS